MDQSLYAAIDHIMNRFDFARVQKVMEFLNWSWAGTGKAPTIEKLRSTAYQMLHGAVQMYYDKGEPKSGMLWATGGFQAVVQTFENGKPRLELLFYVDSASSSGEY